MPAGARSSAVLPRTGGGFAIPSRPATAATGRRLRTRTTPPGDGDFGMPLPPACANAARRVALADTQFSCITCAEGLDFDVGTMTRGRELVSTTTDPRPSSRAPIPPTSGSGRSRVDSPCLSVVAPAERPAGRRARAASTTGAQCSPTCDDGYLLAAEQHVRRRHVHFGPVRGVVLVLLVPEPPRRRTASWVRANGASPRRAVLDGDDGYLLASNSTCDDGTYTSPVRCLFVLSCLSVVAPQNGQLGACEGGIDHGEQCSPTCGDDGTCSCRTARATTAASSRVGACTRGRTPTPRRSARRGGTRSIAP